MANAHIIRIEKNKNFTVMGNYHLQDKNLSCAALGLLSYMLSLPDDWDYSVQGLCSRRKESSKAIVKILNELKEHGYLEVTKLFPGHERNDTGVIKYEYVIHEKSILEHKNQISRTPNQDACFQAVENQAVENQAVENGIQLNTNIQSTKEPNTKEQSTKVVKKKNTKRKSFVKPTLEEIKDYCVERENQVDVEKFFDYYESNGWMVGRNHMKDWKAAIRTWERNNYVSSNQSSQSTTTTLTEKVETTPEIDRAYEFWKKIMRVSCSKDSENVKACAELLEDVGEEGVQRLIMGLAFRSKHGYLPATITGIVDFVGLNRNKVAMQTFCDKHWLYWQQLMKAAAQGKNVWEVY